VRAATRHELKAPVFTDNYSTATDAAAAADADDDHNDAVDVNASSLWGIASDSLGINVASVPSQVCWLRCLWLKLFIVKKSGIAERSTHILLADYVTHKMFDAWHVCRYAVIQKLLNDRFAKGAQCLRIRFFKKNFLLWHDISTKYFTYLYIQSRNRCKRNSFLLNIITYNMVL